MKFICIGRNYAAHAAELNNPVPKKPLIFMKPATAMLKGGKPLYYPEFTQDLHHEIEIVLRICKGGKHITPKFAPNYYEEVTVGIDFTARDIQSQLKSKGHSWEIAKAWDHSAAVGEFIPLGEALKEDGSIDFSLNSNGNTVQQGNTANMLVDFNNLISYVSTFFSLQKGDMIFTGTPKGVGPVKIGDKLKGFIGDRELLRCEIK